MKLSAGGDELPVAQDLNMPTPAPDLLGEVLQELRRLREVVEAQFLELNALRQEVSGLRQLPAPAPPPAPVPDVNEKLAEIWESVHGVQSSLEEQGVFDSKRMRVLLHAYNEALPPRPAGLTGSSQPCSTGDDHAVAVWVRLIVTGNVRLWPLNA